MRAKRVAAGTGVLLACLGACRGGSRMETRAPTELVPAVDAQGASSAALATIDAAVPDAEPNASEGMPRLSPVLDDPRLADVRARQRDHDLSGAARALDTARASAILDEASACAWAYLSGRLHLDAGEAGEAGSAFESVLARSNDAGAPCPLAPYAGLRQAQALLRVGQKDQAIARLRALGDDFPAREEANLALADALVMKGDRASAVPIWRTLLATSPHGARWVDSSLQLALALLDGVDGPPESGAQESLDRSTRVLVESPMAVEKSDVLSLRARAARLLKMGGAPLLTPEERVRQAQAWLDAAQPKRATEAAEAVLQSLPKDDKKHREPACKAAIVRAQAVPHGKADIAADAWGEAIGRCEGQDAQVTALYYGGKASSSAHRNIEATTRYALVEKNFPTHRLADDARFHGALVVLDEGDEAKALAMMASVPDAYPDGDMKGEALFRVALARLDKQDLDGARAALDRMLALPNDDRGWGSGGRAAYYRARVSQLAGDVGDAKSRYAAVVADQPFTFYMLMAFARLRAIDDGGARAAVQSAVSREASGLFYTSAHPELSSPAFDRFARLLEVGEFDAARHQAAVAGLVAESVDPEVVWTLAWLYDRAGAPDLGHAFGRSRLIDYRSHWPAGRWRLPWQVSFPRAWEERVGTESASAGIPSPLTWAIMREESAFNPDARSVASAIGLMQLLVGTAKLTARGTALVVDEASLRRPEVSIALGARLLASLRASFPSNPSLAIAAYNGGSGAVRRWLAERGGADYDVFVEHIPYEETRNYLKRVLASEAAYSYLYAPRALDELLPLPQKASGVGSPSPP